MQNHLRVIFAFITASLPPSNISNTVSLISYECNVNVIELVFLKLSQLKCMIRVYINVEVDINDYRLCASIFDRLKFRKRIG